MITAKNLPNYCTDRLCIQNIQVCVFFLTMGGYIIESVRAFLMAYLYTLARNMSLFSSLSYIMEDDICGHNLPS